MTDVLVVGGGGFVGSAVLRAVAAAPGLRPIAGVRRPGPRRDGIEQRRCDATDPASVASALQGVAFVVNAMMGPGPAMVRAARTLCAAGAGLRRLVHLSSMAVYGAALGEIDEGAPLEGGRGGYAFGKVAAEQVVAAFIASGGAATILRPGIVYGPGGEQWVGRLARLLRAGRLGDLGAAGDGFCNLIYHDDLAACVVAALRTEAAAGEAFNLGEAAPMRWNDYLIDLGGAVGAGPVARIGARRLRLEAALARPLQVGKLAAARAGWPPGRLPEPIPPSLLALFRQEIRLNDRKAADVLGLRRTPYAAGLRRAADWFNERRAAA